MTESLKKSRNIFITARTKSKRLPGKCLAMVSTEDTAIEFLCKRLKHLGYFVVLCTSNSPEDDLLAEVAGKHVAVFRGSEDDKLKRWIDCADFHKLDFFVTADGDDLFVAPELIALAFKQYEDKNHGFIKCTTTPTGSFSWGIEVEALKRIYRKHVKEGMNTEMGFCWFDDVHELEDVPSEYIRHDVRMTLDYIEDLNFFREVISKIGNASLHDILDVIDAHPEIATINIAREQDWKTNQTTQIGKLT